MMRRSEEALTGPHDFCNMDVTHGQKSNHMKLQLSCRTIFVLFTQKWFMQTNFHTLKVKKEKEWIHSKT